MMQLSRMAEHRPNNKDLHSRQAAKTVKMVKTVKGVAAADTEEDQSTWLSYLLLLTQPDPEAQ